MDGRDWTSNMIEVQRARFLVWLQSQRQEGKAKHFGAFGPEADAPDALDESALDDIVSGCVDEGLVKVHQSLGGITSHSGGLTDKGRARAQQIVHARQTGRRRKVASRDAVLDWLYDRDGAPAPSGVEDMQGDPRAFIEGDPFSDGELQQAAAHLAELNLIAGTPVSGRDDPVLPHIQTDGRVCVEQYEGSVARWQQRGQHGAGDTHFVTHFHDAVSGQVGIAGRDVSQTQQQAAGTDELQRLLDDVRQAAVAVDHPELPRLLVYVDTLQAEAGEPELSQEMVERTSDRMHQIAARVGNPALTTAVATLTVGALRLLGIES